jgi:hypothetical protein
MGNFRRSLDKLHYLIHIYRGEVCFWHLLYDRAIKALAG